jgi:methylthioribose-1-phosphate isomerase
VRQRPEGDRVDVAYAKAAELRQADIDTNRRIGEQALPTLHALAEQLDGGPVNILTHCNAGWLACVDWGTATSGVYQAHDAGIAVHVWVSETRPRNQGASLTAFELGAHGVPHTLVVDNACGHLLRRGQVDICLVGSDRVAANGDVCNKIGTYLKALAAKDNGVPFYVALPYSTIDFNCPNGDAIEIEERGADEVLEIAGRDNHGAVARVALAPIGTIATNPGFDVTPARLVTGLITERGICSASPDGLNTLYPEQR